MTRKFLFALVLVVASVGLLFASGATEPEADPTADTGEIDYGIFAGETIELWVPAGPGTAQDRWCRILQPVLAEKLQADIVVVNKPGGSGWVGINEFLRTRADGHKIVSVLLSHVGAGLNPSAPQGVQLWEELDLLGSHMDDPGALFISTEETRFDDLPSLIDYAKGNELIVGISGVGSDDDVPLYWLNNEFGTQIQPVVSSGGTAQNLADILGGHIDFLSNNIGTFSVQSKEGLLKPLVVYADTASELFPDVPTIYEVLDGEGITVGNTRGLAMQKDTPAEYYEVIRWAYEEAVSSQAVVDGFLENGWIAYYREPDDFARLMGEFTDFINGYMDIIGWQ